MPPFSKDGTARDTADRFFGCSLPMSVGRLQVVRFPSFGVPHGSVTFIPLTAEGMLNSEERWHSFASLRRTAWCGPAC
ncbi:hypothetical protein CEE69_26600 [Rhodopirellula bahusiensis]|uniref:Uncharacterized protein n=1 Tax=Rhodopirellula bahusiensis TaxID=2014065 RepID=A0A2G1VZV7_9BACT|nr:hypothetical protein CEE69_26600 [Rhodopirellula bahusiensis]